MKKNDLLKVLGIAFVIYVLVSWIVPVTYHSSLYTQETSTTNPISLFGIVSIPLYTFTSFSIYGLLILVIGGFYGVLNATGAYSKLINNINNKWKNKEKKFLIITIVVLSLLSSLIGRLDVLFILIPFFVTILLKMNYKKFIAFAATVGSLLIGQIGNTLGTDIFSAIRIYLESSAFSYIIVIAVLWIIITVLYALLICKFAKTEDNKEIKKETKNSKKEKNELEEINIPLYKEVETKKSYIPLIVISIVMLVVLILGCYDWTNTFDIGIFADVHEQINTLEINDYPLLKNIFGGIGQLGSWTASTVIFILIVASFVISWIYSIKFNEIFDSFIKGAKEMVLPAIYAILACIIFATITSVTGTYDSSLKYNFLYTIINNFTSSEGFSLFGSIISTALTSFSYNEFQYSINEVASFFTDLSFGELTASAFIFQTIYGLVMLIAPTSVFLLVGLSYLELSYKSWINFIWKFVLLVFGIIVVVSFIILALF